MRKTLADTTQSFFWPKLISSKCFMVIYTALIILSIKLFSSHKWCICVLCLRSISKTNYSIDNNPNCSEIYVILVRIHAVLATLTRFRQIVSKKMKIILSIYVCNYKVYVHHFWKKKKKVLMAFSSHFHVKEQLCLLCKPMCARSSFYYLWFWNFPCKTIRFSCCADLSPPPDIFFLLCNAWWSICMGLVSTVDHYFSKCVVAYFESTI